MAFIRKRQLFDTKLLLAVIVFKKVASHLINFLNVVVFLLGNTFNQRGDLSLQKTYGTRKSDHLRWCGVTDAELG